MVALAELVQWCDSTLQVKQFQDYCPNGLQIEGRAEVERVVTAVTASLQAIEAAIDLKADALLVHHGYFWKGEAAELTGLKGRRVKQLMQADISLIAYHLPLDAHTEYGNNAALADLLGLQIIAALDPSERQPIGNIGMLAQAIDSNEFAERITATLGQNPVIINPRSQLQRIGFCSGAAQDFLSKAAAAGCDAYLSGEVSERTYHEAKEYGMTYFACGHHATERYGIQRLGAALAQQFAITHHYVELDNPI